MKKLYYYLGIIILFSIASFSIISCGDDDDKTPTITQKNVEDSIGTWMCTSSYDTYQGKTYEGLLVGAQIVIKSDGTYTSTADSFGYSGRYVINEDNIIATNNRGETFVVVAQVNGNKMVWQGTSSRGVSFTYTFARE